MRPTKKRPKSISSTSAIGSIANSVSKSIKNVMNANKKDDDFGFSGNDIQGRQRRRKDVSLLYKLANINPLFLIICSGFCVVVFIVAMVLLFSGVSPSQNTNQYRRTPSPYNRKASDYYRKKTETSNKANDQETVDTEIHKLLNQLEKSTHDISASIYNDLDKQMSRLMHKFCLNELDFILDYEAKSTFESHVSAIFQSILDKEKMAYLSKETVLTQYGTLTDEFAVTKGLKYGQCSLLKGLLAKAQQWNLIGNVYDSKPNLFAKKGSDIWNENKDKFAKRDINAAAMELISLAKNDNHNSHLAKQLIPGLINQFCPNVFAFLDKQVKSAAQDKDPKFELINSVDDVLLQLHNHGNIVMNKNEIPAVDVNGFLVAVDKFSLSEENTFESQWASCGLIDKIVYYHNVDIDKQAKVLIDEIRDSNYYAFESQIDIMMLEHCPRTVKVLKADKAGSDPANVYISVFRGELTSFAHKVANGMYIGDTQSFVVTRHGGIMHKNAVSDGRYTECDVIKYIGQQTAVDKNDKRDETLFDEHMFDPQYHSNTFAELQQELHHNAQDMEKDAAAIIKHAVNDEHYELKHLITNLMYLYHSKQISAVTPDAVESMVSEITQYVSALLQIENQETVAWPASHFAVFDVDNGKLVLLDKESEAFTTGNKVESQFFTKVFKLALEAKKEPQRNDVPKHEIRKDTGGGGEKAEDLGQIRAYVSVLLQDIQSQTDIGGLRKDIETDLSHYCADLWNKLSSRSRRVVLSQLLTKLKSNNNDRITDPVVTVDGSIKSAQTVDGSREQMMETCAFITELLTQRI